MHKNTPKINGNPRNPKIPSEIFDYASDSRISANTQNGLFYVLKANCPKTSKSAGVIAV